MTCLFNLFFCFFLLFFWFPFSFSFPSLSSSFFFFFSVFNFQFAWKNKLLQQDHFSKYSVWDCFLVSYHFLSSFFFSGSFSLLLFFFFFHSFSLPSNSLEKQLPQREQVFSLNVLFGICFLVSYSFLSFFSSLVPLASLFLFLLFLPSSSLEKRLLQREQVFFLNALFGMEKNLKSL